MQQKARLIYDMTMILLVMVTMLTLWVDHTVNSTINFIVWLVFLIDYIIRIIMAEKKWQFIKKNPFLLLAVIPLDQFFQVARIVRLFYLFRIKTITKYYVTPYIKQLTYTKKMILLLSVPALLLIETIFIWQMGNKLEFWHDAFIIVFQHLFIFANSLESINHFPSILLLTITSIFGVIIQGLVLQWVFDKLEGIWHKRKDIYSSTKSGG
ncbi:voltage-gated potassium channel [Gracilibacillus orientalis]|uniref:Voltage-gated potassium channel n=1 Tax=Gracilibacillus orientalis TaxID=334253 RepID=A0A1I4KXM1_9BACI|nr:transporter [Gracilibacillus orientalis]SFL83515.1 voltage-gated potassium channel [Gracilibacillus orientalis]